MKSLKRFLHVTIILFCFVSISFAVSEKKYDPIQTALALNYSQMSICRMVTYSDKVVLDQEYDNIINNINLSKIEDREIIQLLMSLMDSLTESKLVAGDKKWLQKEYDKKVEKAVYDSFSNSASLVAGAAGGALTGDFAGATRNLTQVGMQYFNYQKVLEEQKDKLEKSKWELEKETIEFLNYQRKKILKISWELIQRYDLPDEWRLTEKQINNYVEILKDEQIDRRLRKLSRIESEFQAYPPFWYYYGKTAQDSGNRNLALKCYDKYEKVRKGIFRSDPFYSSVAMNRIALLNYNDDKEEVLRNLAIIAEQSKDNNNLITFCALNYLRLRKFDNAKKLFQKNIDEEYQVSLNKRLLGETLLAQRASTDLDSLIDEMAKNDDVKNQDILFLIGRTRQIDLLKKIEDQITDIQLSIDTNLISKADVIVKLPVKWFFEDLEINLSYEEEKFTSAEIEANEVEKAVSCTFESVIDEDEIFENNKPKLFIVELNHPSNPMDVVFQVGLREKTIDSLSGKVTKYKYTPKWIKKKLKGTKLADKKKEKEMEIELIEIRSGKKVFSFENGLLAEK